MFDKILCFLAVLTVFCGCTTNYNEVCAKGVSEVISAHLNAYKNSVMINADRGNTREVAEAIKQAENPRFWEVCEEDEKFSSKNGDFLYTYKYRTLERQEAIDAFIRNMSLFNVDEDLKKFIAELIVNSNRRDYSNTEYYKYLYEFLQ